MADIFQDGRHQAIAANMCIAKVTLNTLLLIFPLKYHYVLPMPGSPSQKGAD